MSQLLLGDCRETLKTLPDASVQCCVTSPPYFGLRDYSTGRWEGGDSSCDHMRRAGTTRGGPRSTLAGGQDATAHAMSFRDQCGRCGAVRIDSQIGLERTPDAYVAELVAVFREVRRVLRDDGTLWLNLGDSYASGGVIGRNDTDAASLTRRGARYGTGAGAGSAVGNHGHRGRVANLKPKDLIGIPWRVAFALQADGWYLRQDIIWHKPNPMPESVRDRCTKAHEYLFLLSKSDRYYFDAEAIAEPAKFAGRVVDYTGEQKANGADDDLQRTLPRGRRILVGATRNRRSVWTVPPKPFAGAHFAVMPEALVEPCILAGTRLGDTVLDPFLGSGTVARVAQRLGCEWIGCELNPAYAALIAERTEQTGMAL